MPVITLQLGQCGNQLGCSFFQALASEYETGEYRASGVEEWFRPLSSREGSRLGAQGGLDVTSASGGGLRGSGSAPYVARAVLIDMEPKVVNTARATAAEKGGWWSYAPRGFLTMQSGAGNNWAHGFHGYGPRVHEDAMELVRREAEACDVMGGFLVLQSMAGGTGAGLGTYVAAALRDEYPSPPVMNACVWPYESGEVIVQSYNSLFTLSHLARVSDGVIVMENEGLHRACVRLHGISRPSFHDMNAVAARALAAALLPAHHRPASTGTAPAPSSTTLLAAKAAAGSSGSAARGRASPSSGPAGVNPPSPMLGGAPQLGPPVRLLSDLVEHLCAHPMYRMLSLRALPQLPAASVDFTTFTWPAITRRLRQMGLNGSFLEEGLDWGLTPTPTTPGASAAFTSGGPTTPATTAPGAGPAGSTGATRESPGAATAAGSGRRPVKSVSSYVVLRGQGAVEADVGSLFNEPGMYPYWACDPLLVAAHPARFARCAMAAAALSNDQSCLAPMRRMQERAYSMLASRAYVHQYEQYGLSVNDFNECFAHVEEIMERYASL